MVRVSALHVSRRAAFAALLSLPSTTVFPGRASALFGFGDDGPQGQFRQIANTQVRLPELQKKLETRELNGDVAYECGGCSTGVACKV